MKTTKIIALLLTVGSFASCLGMENGIEKKEKLNQHFTKNRKEFELQKAKEYLSLYGYIRTIIKKAPINSQLSEEIKKFNRTKIGVLINLITPEMHYSEQVLVLQQPEFLPNSLSEFKNERFGVGVLPYFEKNNKKYILLGREVNSHRQEWKEFSGGAEKEKNKMTYEHPDKAATREFCEEIIAHKTLQWTQDEVEKYISFKGKNTTDVIARYNRFGAKKARITYFTKFSEEAIEKIVSSFENAYKDVNLPKEYKEKDALIVVAYDDLVKEIQKGNYNIDLKKVATATNKNSQKLEWSNNENKKPIGKKIVLDRILYNILRAHHKTDAIFVVNGSTHKYVKNTIENGEKYHFYSSEPVN